MKNTEVSVLRISASIRRMNASIHSPDTNTHSQNLEANYEIIYGCII